MTLRNMEKSITHHDIGTDDVLEADTQFSENKHQLTDTDMLDTEIDWDYDKETG